MTSIAESEPQGERANIIAEARVQLDALHAFERIEPRKLTERAIEQAGYEYVATSPAMLRHPQGQITVCLRYGVVVFCGGTEATRAGVLELLETQGNPRRPGDVESESLTIHVQDGQRDRCGSGDVWLGRLSTEHLQLVSEVLARSVLLASYEEALRDAYQLVEPLAQQLAHRGRSRHSSRALLQQIGTALSIRLALVSRAEVTESPDLLWERPELERLFQQLMVEFDIRVRNAAIADKLQVLSDTAKTALDLVQHSQTLRVEWYIVILIIAEIALTLLGK